MGLNCEHSGGNGVSMDSEMGGNSSEAIRMRLWVCLWMRDSYVILCLGTAFAYCDMASSGR